MFDGSIGYEVDRSARVSQAQTSPAWTPLWRMLKQQRLTIAVAALGGMALGLVSGLTRSAEYEATAVLTMRTSAEIGSMSPGIETRPSSNRGPDPALRTRRIESPAVNLVAAEAVIAHETEAGLSWKKQVREAAGRIKTRVSPETQIVEIVSRAPEPEMASELANALAVEVILGESPQFAGIAFQNSSWERATMAERLESLRGLDAELRDITRQAKKSGDAFDPSLLNAVRVIRVARPDSSPVPTPWRTVTSRGAIAGLFLGLVAVTLQASFFQRFFEVSIRRPGEASQLLRIRELGSLPDASCDGPRKMTPAGKSDEEPLRPETASLLSPVSDVAENVRGVRTSLLAQEPGRTRVIVVTSANPGEGKTTVAANLAASLAEMGRRTALVDANLRRPRLHQVFDVRNRRGLFDLLSSERVNSVELRKLLQKISADRPLWLLPAGVAPQGAPGLLHGAQKRDLIETLASEFDHVIIDAPAVLMVSDARALARLADGVLLVVRAGVTRPAEAVEAKRWLWEEGAHLVGGVLNCWNTRKFGSRRAPYTAELTAAEAPERARSSAA